MGLLDGVLPAVYSASNTLKRKVGGLLSDPVGTIQQQVGLLNDNARAFNQLTSQAAQENVQSIKSGGGGFGPASQQLAGKLADAYNPMGMVVWHGSPHKFSKFDSSKIGTGEGAQAYGHGLYLAESPEVADSYKSILSEKIVNFRNKQPMTAAEKRLQSKLASVANTSANDGIGEMVNKAYMDIKSPIRDRLYGNSYAGIKPLPRKKLGEALAMQRAALRLGAPVVDDAGSLYKVDLPDDAIAKMLDWDKPLSQQAPEVQALIKKTKSMLPPNAMDDLGGDMSLLYGPDLTGADFLGTMNSLQPNFGETALQRVGVPGVRYLDGGSRGAGSGTSNFVVFPGNEGLLSILERNGQPIK